MTTSDPSSASRLDAFLAWLKQFNQRVLVWAASLSWWQLIGLALIVLIASSWIGEKLNLRHERQRVISVSVEADNDDDEDDAKPPARPTSTACEGDQIRIGGPNGIFICDDSKARQPGTAAHSASQPSPPVTAPTEVIAPGASTPSAKPKSNRTEDRLVQRETRRTLGGWVGDLLSALMVAAFAYFIAAKIIVRKTAETEAKLRAATFAAEQEAMQRQLVQARLKLLQAQVEPHFLFNTLAAVDYLIETDAARASVMQKKLITYLRGALPQMRQESSTLGRELGLIRAYLDLLKMRIEDRLEVEILVPPILINAVFPPMILQSLVENAIKHGIEPKPEGGTITVLAKTVDDQLWVEVSDTGVGLPDGDIFGTSTNGTGLGLDNIRKRLSLLYPGASRIELRSGHQGGTTVRLVIPYQLQNHEQPGSATHDA